MNVKGSNFLLLKSNKGRHSDIDEESENVTDDDDEDSSSDGHNYAFLQHNNKCSIQDEAAIPKEWILHDSQSTANVFSNGRLLTNVRDAKRNLILYCNAGNAVMMKKGDLKGYSTVWFYPMASETYFLLVMSKRSTR